MEGNAHQGLFGEFFVAALASAAGLSVAKPHPDVTGDDYTITYPGLHGGVYHPKIDVQVKSWAHRSAVRRNGCWDYSLKTAHYNNLAGPNFSLPRFLFLVIVPDEWTDYAVVAPDSMRLQHAAYWLSLRDWEPERLAERTRVRVPVPDRNLLTVEKLLELIVPGPEQREA